MSLSSSIARAPLSRRTFLRGAGVALALPLLDAMRPAWAADSAVAVPRRMVAIETNMGILPQFFFPEQAGPRLRADALPAEAGRASASNLTVFSGVSHPGVTGGHAAEKCFLTGTPHPGARRLPQLDLARPVRGRAASATRPAIPSLVLAMSSENNQTLSFTRSGAPIPAERSPNRLFRRALRARQAGGGRGQRRGAAAGPQHARLRRRPVAAAEPIAVAGRPAAAGPVLHLGARARAAAAQLGSLGAPAQAARSTPSRRRTSTTPASSCARRS